MVAINRRGSWHQSHRLVLAARPFGQYPVTGMMSRMSQLSVSDAKLPPLKDESALSVMLRIASSNALTRKQTLDLLLQHPVSCCELDLLRIGIEHADMWGSGIGWRWQPSEIQLMAALPGLNSVMWSSYTRWCPVCIGFGFHSIWFQLSALAACPMHGCALIQQCEGCGVAPGPYRVSKALFQKPYHCVSCGTPFAGHQRCLRERLDFFRQTEEVERVFAPLAQWYGRAVRELVFLDASNRRLRNNDVPEFKARMLDGAIRELVPFPHKYALSTRPPVHLRSWSRRLACGASRNDLPSRYGLLSTGTVLSVYQSTTRSLARLVMQQAPGDRMCEKLEFYNGDVASLDGWRSVRLALVIMRCVFEEPYFLVCDAPIRGAVLRCSIFGPALIGNCLLRVTCRALVLATFLAAHELADRYIARGFIFRRDLAALPDEFVLLVGNVSAGVQDGVVALPETTLTEMVACGTADSTALAASVGRLNDAFSEAIMP